MMAPMLDADALGLLGLAARATLVLGAALLLTWVLRRGAAATRHVLWTLTFVVLLGMPLAAAWLPSWEVPVLPAVSAAAPPRGAVDVPPEDAASNGIALEDRAPSDVVGDGSPRIVEGTVTSASTGTDGSTLPLGLLLWAIGSAGAIASVTVGTLRFRSLVQGATPVENPVWLMHIGRIRARLGIDADVRLLTSADISTPMTGGWRRPVVLLPASATEWTPERRDVVLLHEMIHVKRHDALRQVVAQAALALYWFNPLSWIAVRFAAVCREEACDEAVLATGTRPSEYAGHLLALAESISRRPALAALPMIQPSQLERRIMAILSPRRPRTSAIATAALVVALGGFGLSAALARPVEAPATDASPTGPVDAVGILADVPETGAETPPEWLGDRLDGPRETLGGAPPVVPGTMLQDPACQPDEWRGNFSGTISTRSGRQERSGVLNGDRIIQRYVDDLRLCMRIHGEVVMNDDRTAVRAIGRGGWVALESEEGDLRRLIITEGADGIDYAWSVDGRSRPFDAEAGEWRDRMFRILDAYWEASSLRGQESSLRGRISSARGHVSSLRGKISSARGHVSSLNGRISSARGRVSSMNGRISSMRGHVSSLNGRISSLRARLSGLRSARSSSSSDQTRNALDAEITGLEERIRDTEREIADYDLEGRVRAVEEEIADYDLSSVESELEAEIRSYNVEGRVAALEQEIEDYDLEGRTAALEREIDELDADRRAEALERGVESDVAALRRLIGR